MDSSRHTRSRLLFALFALAAFALCPRRAAAGVNRWSSLGPRSNAVVTTLTADASSPDILYAGTSGGGVFKSSDAGQTWTPANTGLNDGDVRSLAVDPTVPGTVYAATGLGGVFRTTDGGATWILAFRSPSDPFVSLAIDLGQPSRLYAASLDGNLFVSTDRGGSWAAAAAGVRVVSQGPQALAVCRDSTVYTLLAGPSGVHVARSADGGVTWIPANAGTAEWTAAFQCDPSDPRTVYVVLDQVLTKSSDGGQTWSSLTSNIALITSVAISSADPKKIAFGTQDGSVFQSLDGGATYTGSGASALGPSASDGVRALLVGGKASPAILASRGDSLMKGLFGNEPAWHASTQGLDAASLSAIAVSPSSSAVLLTADGSSPLRTADEGANWTADASTGGSLSNIWFLPSDSLTALAAGNPGTNTTPGIYRTGDGGATWKPASTNVEALGFAFPAGSTGIAYAATDRGIQKSIDSGTTWRLTGGGQSPSYAVLADSVGSGVLYATWGLSSSRFSYGYDELTVEKSTDDGKTWNKSDTGLPQDAFFQGPDVSALAMDPSNQLTLYAGTQNNGVYRSTDGAATWQAANNGIETLSVQSLALDPTRPSTLYLLSPSGIYRSDDKAHSWFPINDGLANLALSALSIDATGRHLFASTLGGGVFAMDLEPPPSSCADDEDHACYLGRFLVSASARPPFGNLPPLPVPLRQGDRFGSFRLRPDNTMPSDIFLKIVDGRSLPGHAFWIFHAGLTQDGYALTVTDTSTGLSRVYTNGPNRLGCGGIDTDAFPDAGAGGAAGNRGSALSAGSGDSLALAGGRFSVVVSATDPRTKRTAKGLAMPQDDLDGYFSLPDFTGDPAFPEVFVRVSEQLDGSLTLDHTGLTDLAYEMTVTDSASGLVTTLRNNTTDELHPCGGSSTPTVPGP